ncbi:MAG TPA: DUF1800 domain-containing protein [Alphaproteobacteria bacterium]|nr:DUF1800 domain-containing protein [Alphaproteobacteria bacterium]
MALDKAFIATTRYGLGPRPGDLKLVASDPKGWLTAQLDHPVNPRALDALPSPEDQMRQFFALRRERNEQRRQVAAAPQRPIFMRSTVNEPAPATVAEAPNAGANAFSRLDQPIREIYLSETEARTFAAIDSETPLVERMVTFWSNHFTVSIQRGEIAGLCGPFEREAIRPYVLGRYHDMLNAVVRHPAMLIYLDNARSIGPNSIAGKRGRNVGINENLGRELLELHTLGVKGGYGQHDVEAMARMLTGWTVVPIAKPDGGRFYFEPRIHEPGPKSLLGVTYPESGQGETLTALAALSRHPSTAKHVAEKLARHFIADDPPPAAVERIAAVFQRTGGDLKEVTRAAIDSPEAWTDPLAKVKAPQDYVVSLVRATGARPSDGKLLIQSLRMLDQGPFSAPSPAGWPDRGEDWLGPEALMHRIEWANAAAKKIGGAVPAEAILAETIAPVAAPQTREAIASSGDPVEKLTLLFASREFQRR